MPATPKRELAFQQWYADPERDVEALAKSVQVSRRTIDRWMQKYNWQTRAAELDQRARVKAERELVKRRAEYFERVAREGALLKAKGVEYLAKSGVDNGQQAINAVAAGDELQRRALGVPDKVVKVLGMSDDELGKYLAGFGFSLDGSAGEGLQAQTDSPPDPSQSATP